MPVQIKPGNLLKAPRKLIKDSYGRKKWNQ